MRNLKFPKTVEIPDDLVPRGALTSGNSGELPAIPLTVVRAPGGAGKTVLLAEWCRAAGEDKAPSVWFATDQATADRLSFWSAVVTTLHDAGLVRPGAALGTVIPSLGATDDLRRLLQPDLRQLPDGLRPIIDSF